MESAVIVVGKTLEVLYDFMARSVWSEVRRGWLTISARAMSMESDDLSENVWQLKL